ncbi:MAG: 3'-5' exonuclease domain-containing protein 2 [Chlorobi bacterium]|nr:3'-5' exonuclease domain-containing protein 2 [Chlorobiota bacterium]
MHTSITKEELEELPLVKFSGEIIVVDRPEHFHIVTDELSNEKVIGFDTETKPSFKKGRRHEVALLQLATTDKAYLIRLNKTGLNGKLLDILSNPDIIKVGVGIRDDIRALKRLHNFEPAGFIEVQDMAQEAGLENISLKKLAALVMNVRVSKRQRLSNWEAEELTESQMTYAATDAWAALLIYEGLNKKFPGLKIKPLS